MKECSLIYQGVEIPYKLYIKPVKNINLRINYNGEIKVSANKYVTMDTINNFVMSKAEWIFRNMVDIQKIKEQQPDSRFYEGKTVYFLGKKYIIKIIRDMYSKVYIKNNYIVVKVKNSINPQKAKEIYTAWLYNQCYFVFSKILNRMLSLTKKYNIKKPEIYVRNMKTRWGSCQPSRYRIGLNFQLIKADEKCIEQVILHELVHFIHPNHSSDFYGILNELMPDWKSRKKSLEINYKDGV